MTFKDNLSNHIDAAHPGTFELKYFCSECGKGFMFKYSMTVHYHQVHVKGKVIYPKYYKNSNKSCTFFCFGYLGRQGSTENVSKVFYI